MSDCEEAEFFWESLILPKKRKRNKDSKKDRKRLKHKNNITMETDENIPKKKKKNNKLKEATAARKAKKKEKKKKKNGLKTGDSFILTQASCAPAKTTVKPEILNPCSNDKLKPDPPTQDSKKKSKKKVAFDLSPGYVSVKHPKFVSSSLLCPKESTFLENKAVRDSESCSQVTVTGHSQGSTHNNDSQCNSEDINSQDLFITQKAFRPSPPEPSSGEASCEAIAPTPQMCTQQDKLHTSATEIKQHLEGSYECPQDSRFHQQHGETNEHVKQPKTVQVHLKEEEEREVLNKAHCKNKNKKMSFQTQMGQSTNLTKKKKVLCPVAIEPSGVNCHLAEPIYVNPVLDAATLKKNSCVSSHQSTTNTSTQTENLFTTELSSYLNFCQKRRGTSHFGDLKPLDLSLPQRARKDLGSCLFAKTSSSPGEIRVNKHKEPNLCPSCSSAMKDSEASTQDKGETTRSSQSESEPKSADTTTSSEDNDPHCRTGKLDLTQVRAIQTRLNESFFFRTKGEGQSPRAESPLMKLTQGRDVKSRKGN